jgi:prepilin-type N-terminal cleavage/methylation domain-containing protein
MPSDPRRLRQTGFTLLEVLVALTITGLALGALLGVIAGNKRLAWRSEATLLQTAQIRSRINLAQLNDGQGEVLVDFAESRLLLRDALELETPERKTQGSIHALRGFDVVDADGETRASGTYWVELALPE